MVRPRLTHVTDGSSGSLRVRVWSVAAGDLRSEQALEEELPAVPGHMRDYARHLERALPGEALRSRYLFKVALMRHVTG